MVKKVKKKVAVQTHSRPRRPSTTMLLAKQRERSPGHKTTKPSTGVVEMTTPTTSSAPAKGLLTTEEEKKKKEQEELAEKAKEEKEKKDKEPALGSLAGGKLKSGSLGSTTYLAEVYEGIGPLTVPCTRGEQKAISGDTIVTLTIEKDAPEDDVVIIFIVPKEGANAILGSQQDLTNADYDSIVSEKSARSAQKKLEKESGNRGPGLPKRERELANPVGSRITGSTSKSSTV